MEWLVIIVILIVIAVGMVWFRTVRQGPDTVDSSEPHRLDESITPAADADKPLPPGGTAVAGGGTGGPAVDPPSGSTWATEEAGRGEPGSGEDLPPSETRPGA